LACAHTALAGSDLTRPVLRWSGLALAAVILVLTVLRLKARPARPAPLSPPQASQTHEPTPKLEPQPAGPSPARTPTDTEMVLLGSQTTWEAAHVLSLRLRCPNGAELPSWEPGAHIELALPSGRRRQYSLCGDPDDHHSYRIAVLQVPQGRGGSVEIHT